MFNLLRAPDFVAAAKKMQSETLLPSSTADVMRSSAGQRVDLRPDVTGFLHPWTTEARWNADAERWEARVAVAGFVNGLEPTVRTLKPEGGTEVVSILDGPWSPLPMRQVGGEGDGMPAFFSALGARAPINNLSITATGGVSVTDSLADEAPRRSLYAGELFLAVARPTYRTNATVVDASGTSGLVVDYSITYDTTQLDLFGRRARLRLAGQFPAVRRPTWFERLQGTFQDDGEDRIRVATVFLLSPPSPEGGPDASWTPFIQHHLFWNLRYGAKAAIPRRLPAPIRLFTGLAGGFGDAIGNQFLAPINELTAQLDLALNATTPEGRFWTHA